MSKVLEYVGVFHVLKDRIKESWTQYWASEPQTLSTSTQPSIVDQGGGGGGGSGGGDERESNFRMKVRERLERLKKQSIRRIDRSSSLDEDFSHLTRPKTRRELLQISAAVMGIEFSYAAETAFVSPLLLNIGLRHRHMTLIWCLSPLVGFFVTPLLGSLSDGCRSALGRRRPFILLLSIGIILGLILVPNGKLLGRAMGDTYAEDGKPTRNSTQSPHDRILPISRIFLEPSPEHNLTGVGVGVANESQSQPFSKAQKTSAYFSKFQPLEEGQDSLRARNNLENREDSAAHFLKGLRSKSSKKFGVGESNRNPGESINYEGSSSRSSNNKYSIIHPIRGASESQSDSESSELRESIAQILNQKKVPQTRNQEAKAFEKIEQGESDHNYNHEDENSVRNHPWSLVFTILGTVLLDFDADACQSPARAYMLDVTIPEDHARGLSTFTVMAGLGGSLGYALGALNWENTYLGDFFGGQVRAVFTLVLFIFIACVIATIRSFREIPLEKLWLSQNQSSSGIGIGIGSANPRIALDSGKEIHSPYSRFHEELTSGELQKGYGATGEEIHETSFIPGFSNGESNISSGPSSERIPTFREYLGTIVLLPKSLQWLCLTNFFCWMSLVCYSLYFTDFVGEAVFGGDPTAPLGSVSRGNYEDGIRFGCLGMSLYSLSCSLYSLCIESFVSRFGAKRVYITGQVVYSIGMVLMAIFRNPIGVIVFSWTAGIMYATLFTMPYLLVARYHAAETFDVDIDDLVSKPSQIRGLGTDVAIVSSMVFLAQMTQALTLGSVVTAVGSTTAIICAAAVFAACGALSATRVLYLDL